MMEERDDVITLTDEDGNEIDFTVIDGVEYEGKTYLMLIETESEDDEDAEAVMLRLEGEGDDETLVSVDDDDEFEAVAKLFEERADEDGEFDVEPEKED